MREKIPVIDLFAGPGGLGEGFASYRPGKRKNSAFKILASVEKDYWAHQTLELRSFFRQFINRPVPDDYYRYIRGEIHREELFAAWPREAKLSGEEALWKELGKSSDDEFIYQSIEQRLERYNAREWALIGGPPCQAYSVIGRSRMRSVNPDKFEKDSRHFLYREYLQILARFRPAVFVMENVKGLLSSRIGEDLIFSRILSDLKDPIAALEDEELYRVPLGYRIFSLAVRTRAPETLRPENYIIPAEHYGIPQTRHRVILLGVRSDLTVIPDSLRRQSKQVSIHQVIGDLPPIRSYLSKREDRNRTWKSAIDTIRTQPWFQDLETSRDDLFSDGLFHLLDEAICQVRVNLSTGQEFMQGSLDPVYQHDWYHDPRLNGVANHVARAHMEADLHRYLFFACFAEHNQVSPQLRHMPAALRPDHRSVREDTTLETFDDRFRVQVKDKPATTITSHIAKDGHYNIHYDVGQCRSLTVREAARVQTFPDNYFFEGPRTQQYRQVGNAVPPLLAHQVAEIVHRVFEQIHENHPCQPD